MIFRRERLTKATSGVKGLFSTVKRGKGEKPEENEASKRRKSLTEDVADEACGRDQKGGGVPAKGVIAAGPKHLGQV